MSRLEHSIAGIDAQQENRKLWADMDDAQSIAKMIEDEASELSQAVEESMVTGDVFSVASELGDVLYLALRMCRELGLDPADLIDMKVKRNSVKYSDAVMNNGYSREEATRISKASWKAMGGDTHWSLVYLDHLADVENR